MGMSNTPASVVGSWASEISCFTYGAFPGCCSCTCGHDTQLVWRSSSQVGCGRATCGSEEIWVCNYDPPGNYTNQTPY